MPHQAVYIVVKSSSTTPPARAAVSLVVPSTGLHDGSTQIWCRYNVCSSSSSPELCTNKGRKVRGSAARRIARRMYAYDFPVPSSPPRPAVLPHAGLTCVPSIPDDMFASLPPEKDARLLEEVANGNVRGAERRLDAGGTRVSHVCTPPVDVKLRCCRP